MLGSLATNGIEIEAGSVVSNLDEHLRALSLHLQAHPTQLGLAAFLSRLRCLDPVDHGVSQQVLKGREHALQNLAVQFALRAFHGQLGRLRGLRGCLPHDSCQPGHMPLERNHACLHEPVLKLDRDPGLLSEESVRLIGQGPE